MESKAATYVTNRLTGMGSREAAREAGFETGVPGGHALKLYRAAKAAQNKALGNLPRRIEQINAEIEEFKAQLRELRRFKRARTILEKVEDSTDPGESVA